MITAAAAGYAVVGIMYLLLVALLLTSWRGHRLGVFLIAACLVNAVWGGMLAWSGTNPSISAVTVFIVEVCRAGTWVGFLIFLAAKVGINRNLRVLSLAVVAAVMAGGLVVWARSRWFAGSGDIGSVLFPGGLAVSLIGLLLIEQVFRNSPPEAKWGLKPLVLGLGGIFAYDLFLYSQAVLFNAIDAATWVARGGVNALFVPAIALAARRNPDWELRIFVSRHVVFYSTTLVAVGAYLLLMSFGGYLLVQFGGSWGALARVVFFAGAILVLLILLFSSSLRARAKVFLSKHFFHNKYDYRDEWMRLISTLAEFERYPTREVAIKAIAQVVGSPAGILWVRNDREGRFLLDARYDCSESVTDITFDDELVTFIEKDHWLIDLAEFERDPEKYEGLELPDWLKSFSSAWLIVPLILGEELLGLVLLKSAPGTPALNYEDRDLLKTVGNHVAIHVAQARAEKLLTEAQQFEAYNKLTAFLMHDLNNLIAQQSLIVENADSHKRNPEFVDDAISTIAGSVERMKSVMRRLKRGSEAGRKRETEPRFIVSTAVDECAYRSPSPKLRLDDISGTIDVDAEELKMVLVHLIRNAQEATREDGEVGVSLRQEDGRALIMIEDDGAGMSEEFVRDRLFRPFDSTKGNQGMGIGAYQARELVRKLGGDIKVNSAPNEGTRITISLALK